MKHLPHIDGLRALAILPVVLYHLGAPLFPGGYVGVDVFFVLSGFLITGVIAEGIEDKTFTLAHFYERRARRILPAFFAMCALSLVLALFLLLPADFRSFSKALEGASAFASNFIFARNEGYFAESLSAQPLLHTWSLSVEEQFYLLFPLLLLLFRKNPARALPLLLGLLAASLALGVHMLETRPERAFYLLPPRAWELLAGAALQLAARTCPARLKKTWCEAAGVLGLALYLFACTQYTKDTAFPGLAALVPALGALLMIGADLKQETRIGRLLSARPLTALGLVSYGLYLYHWPLIIFAQYDLGRALFAPEAAAVGSLALLLSILSWKYIEQPVRAGRFLKARRPLFAAALAGLGAFFIAGALGVAANGLPWRFSPDVLQYAQGAKDTNWAFTACLPRDPEKDPPCKIGDASAAPDFLYWGDSHAAAFQPAIDALAKKHGRGGLAAAFAGCPPLQGASRADGYVDFDCAALAEKVLAMAARHKIKTVLLAARWDMYAYGFEKGGSETARSPRLGYQDLRGAEAFAAAYQNMVRALKAQGLDVWVIRQAPPHLANVPAALAKAAYLGHDRDALRRRRDDVAARLSLIDETFGKTPGVRFLDPAEKLCPEKYCIIEHGGRALYSDNNHLSVTGALYVKDALEPFFRPKPETAHGHE